MTSILRIVSGEEKIRTNRKSASLCLIDYCLEIIINNDLDMHIQAKTNDRRVRRFGDILAPLSREIDTQAGFRMTFAVVLRC